MEKIQRPSPSHDVSSTYFSRLTMLLPRSYQKYIYDFFRRKIVKSNNDYNNNVNRKYLDKSDHSIRLINQLYVYCINEVKFNINVYNIIRIEEKIFTMLLCFMYSYNF